MTSRLKIPITFVCLLLTSTTCWSEETLVRLSFWINPTQHTDFEKAYTQQAFPILQTHGLTPSSKQPRKTPDNVFSRLFEIESPDQMFKIRSTLSKNTLWLQLLQNWGTTFSAETQDNAIRWKLDAYQTSPIPDKIVMSGRPIPTGSGKSHWKIYETVDGLSGADISDILQDRRGDLWITTYGGGVHRFDGQTFTHITIQDGLANMAVHAVFEDRDGYLWFGTQGGACRFDPSANGTKAAWKTFTTEDGLVYNWVFHIFQDREGAMWFGTFGKGISRFDGKTWKTFTTQDGLLDNNVHNIFQDKEGHLWFGTSSGASRFDGHTFTTIQPKGFTQDITTSGILQDRDGNIWFSAGPDNLLKYDGKTMVRVEVDEKFSNLTLYPRFQDRDGIFWFDTTDGAILYDGKTWSPFSQVSGLDTRIREIMQDRDGNIWFRTNRTQLVQYTHKRFWSLTFQDGLPNPWVRSIVQDKNGDFWFGIYDGGLARYDGKTLTSFTRKDGLPSNRLRLVYRDRQDNLWIGGSGGGVLKYNGQTFDSFMPKHGLPGSYVYAIFQDHDENMWFSTWRGGVTRYDGKHFVSFSTADGLTDDIVRDIIQDRDGNMWFATHAGVTQYDGQTFKRFPLQGVPNNLGILSLFQDRDGIFWFGTWHGGLTRYNPLANSEQEKWKTFTTKDGLAHNDVWSIFQDQKGHLWFSTGGGISQYDGHCFQNLTVADGLAGNRTEVNVQDNEGNIWFSTDGGATRYNPPTSATPPQITIRAVIADRRYENATELSLSSQTSIVTFEFQSRNYRTRPEAMVYRYRLKGYDKNWYNTQTKSVSYPDLPLGNYIFEVSAVDRDLIYSAQPATVTLTIHPPYNIIALGGCLVLALIGLTYATKTSIQRRQERDRAREELLAEAEEELQTAREMQMSLMPTETPQIKNLDIAGQCITANHVGGDFFQYFKRDDRFTFCLADVTGHAMEAAIPVVMFSGILESEIQHGTDPQTLFERLNRTLSHSLSDRTFVCFSAGELDLSTQTLRLSNAACPYPYHFHAQSGELTELELDAYPLGVRSETAYNTIETQLHPGDCIILVSDGLPEAENENNDPFTYERLAETIQKICLANTTANAILNQLIQEIKTFQNNAPQTDDMTCVVLKIK